MRTRAPVLLGQRGVHQADGSLANDQNRVVGGQVEHLYALEHGIEGLDEGGLLEGHIVGDANYAAVLHHEVHDADVLGKAAAGGLEAGRDAGLLVERALRGRLLAAVVALAAGNVMEGHHPVADGIAGDAGAGFDNRTGHLVAEDARCGVGAVVDFLKVSTADAAGGDLDEQFACADTRNGHGFHAHVVDAAVDNGAHGGGKRRARPGFSGFEIWVAIRFPVRLFRRENRVATPRCFGKPFCYFRPSGRARASRGTQKRKKGETGQYGTGRWRDEAVEIGKPVLKPVADALDAIERDLAHRGQPGDGCGFHVDERGLVGRGQASFFGVIGNFGAGGQPRSPAPGIATKALARADVDHAGEIVGAAGSKIRRKGAGPADGEDKIDGSAVFNGGKGARGGGLAGSGAGCDPFVFRDCAAPRSGCHCGCCAASAAD